MQKIRWWNVMNCIEYTIHICNKDFGLKCKYINVKMYFNQIQNNLHISNEDSNSLFGGNDFHFTAMFIHRTTSSIEKIFKTSMGIQ
jgi:hypothetical protein